MVRSQSTAIAGVAGINLRRVAFMHFGLGAASAVAFGVTSTHQHSLNMPLWLVAAIFVAVGITLLHTAASRDAGGQDDRLIFASRAIAVTAVAFAVLTIFGVFAFPPVSGLSW